MAKGLNRFFLQDTKSFIQSNYMTVAGLAAQSNEVVHVDLRREPGVEPSVVRIVPGGLRRSRLHSARRPHVRRAE